MVPRGRSEGRSLLQARAYILVNILASTRAKGLELPSSRSWKMSEGWSLLQVGAYVLVTDRLVQELGGCISLPVEAREREKVVAFCMWVPVYWYEFAPGQNYKQAFLILKKTAAGGFCPTLGFHLKPWCSCVFLMCDDLFYFYCTQLLFIWF